ncbi:unnamed protein product [Dibothriocephalus latus]|uniref:Uncharacterized protein n=1 Tax=Dibothriocephalus latus TaxID=60516 RepID=A0A3P7L766_DIBLA|nr:unnamed protein product [Dibothriocephalus latus]
MNNFRDWRRCISEAFSVLKTFDECGLNQVNRGYGCVWRTQALDLSVTLTERKKLAEQRIHEALGYLRAAFENSNTEDNGGKGNPERLFDLLYHTVCRQRHY